MAIVIPSKNIYQKENPKVRDNVIERIEVNAVEVVPDNEYETPVYNKQYIENGIAEEKQISLEGNIYNLGGTTYSATACYVSIIPYYSNNIEIHIPIVSNNKYIDDLLLGVNKNDNENIKLRVVGDIIKKNATASMDYSGGTTNMKISDITYSNEEIISSNQTINISSLKENYNLEYTFDGDGRSSNITSEVNINQKELSINASYTWNATATASIKINSLSNIYSIEKASLITIDNIDYYKLDLKVLCGVEYDILAGHGFYFRDETNSAEIWGMKGVNYKYVSKQIEITVYGNTIGIDLVDKTVYINGETQKKVHSIDGNELMQTTNYIKDTYGNANAIEKMYGDTQLAYSRGKETATIRCSISDYYEENGEKAISIDKSTGRMSFKLYDQVIPMVYTNDGDVPMSLCKDGTPKVFQVLGSKIYYDGAVWQELSLQEI